MKQISAASLLRSHCPVFVDLVGVDTFSFALASGVPPTVVRIRRSVNTLGTVPKRTTPAGVKHTQKKERENDLSVFSMKRGFVFRVRVPREQRERKRRRRRKKRGVLSSSI